MRFRVFRALVAEHRPHRVPRTEPAVAGVGSWLGTGAPYGALAPPVAALPNGNPYACVLAIVRASAASSLAGKPCDPRSALPGKETPIVPRPRSLTALETLIVPAAIALDHGIAVALEADSPCAMPRSIRLCSPGSIGRGRRNGWPPAAPMAGARATIGPLAHRPDENPVPFHPRARHAPIESLRSARV